MGTSSGRSDTKRKQDVYNYYTSLKHYFEVSEVKSLDRAFSIRAQKARSKLLKLSFSQFYELSTDVSDELKRRISEGPSKPDFLLPKSNFHVKRNQARQKLANLSQLRFNELVDDILYEIERRGLNHYNERTNQEQEQDLEEEPEELEEEELDDDTFKNPSNLNNFEDYEGFSASSSPIIPQGPMGKSDINSAGNTLDRVLSNNNNDDDDNRHAMTTTMTTSGDDSNASNLNNRPGSKASGSGSSFNRNNSGLQTPTTAAALLQSSSVIPKKASIDWSSSEASDASENEQEMQNQDQEGEGELAADTAHINETLLMNESSMAQSSVFPSMRKSMYGTPDTTTTHYDDDNDKVHGGYIHGVDKKRFLSEGTLATEDNDDDVGIEGVGDANEEENNATCNTRIIQGTGKRLSAVDKESTVHCIDAEADAADRTTSNNRQSCSSAVVSPSGKNDYLQRELIALNTQLGDLSVENENLKQKVSELEMELKLKVEQLQRRQRQGENPDNDDDDERGKEKEEEDTIVRSIDLLHSAQIGKFMDPNGIIPIILIVQLNQAITNFYNLIDSGKHTTQLFQYMAKIVGLVSTLLIPADLPDYKEQVILLKTSLSYAITTVRYYAIYGKLLPKVVIQAAIGEISFAVCNLISVTKLQVTEEQRQVYLESLAQRSKVSGDTTTGELSGLDSDGTKLPCDPSENLFTTMISKNPGVIAPAAAAAAAGSHHTLPDMVTSPTSPSTASGDNDYFLVNPRDLRRESIEKTPVKPLKLTQKFGMGSGTDMDIITSSSSVRPFDSKPRKPSNAGLFNLFVDSNRNNSTSAIPPRKPKPFLNLASPVKPRLAPVSGFSRKISGGGVETHFQYGNENNATMTGGPGININATRSEPLLSTPAKEEEEKGKEKKEKIYSNGVETTGNHPAVFPRTTHSNLHHQITIDSQASLQSSNDQNSTQAPDPIESSVKVPVGILPKSPVSSLSSPNTPIFNTAYEAQTQHKPSSSLAAGREDYNSSETLDHALRVHETSLSQKINEFNSSSNDVSDSSSFAPELRARQISLSEKIDKFSSSSNEANDLHELHAVESEGGDRDQEYEQEQEQHSLSPNLPPPDDIQNPALTSQPAIVQENRVASLEGVTTARTSVSPDVVSSELTSSNSQAPARSDENSSAPIPSGESPTKVVSTSVPLPKPVSISDSVANATPGNDGSPRSLPVTDTINSSGTSPKGSLPSGNLPSMVGNDVVLTSGGPIITDSDSIKDHSDEAAPSDTSQKEEPDIKRSGSSKRKVSAAVAAFSASLASVGSRLGSEIAKSLKRQPSGKTRDINPESAPEVNTIETKAAESTQHNEIKGQTESHRPETPTVTRTPSLGFTVSRTISETSPISYALMSPVRGIDFEQPPSSQEHSSPGQLSRDTPKDLEVETDTPLTDVDQQPKPKNPEELNSSFNTNPIVIGMNPTTSDSELNPTGLQSKDLPSSSPGFNQIYTSVKLSASIDEIFSRSNNRKPDDYRAKSNRSEGYNGDNLQAPPNETESMHSGADRVGYGETLLRPAEDAASINLNESPRESIISTEGDTYSTVNRQVDGQVAPKITHDDESDSEWEDEIEEDTHNSNDALLSPPTEYRQRSINIKRESSSDDEMFCNGRAFRIVGKQGSVPPSSQPLQSFLSSTIDTPGGAATSGDKPSERRGFGPVIIGKPLNSTTHEKNVASDQPDTVEIDTGAKVKVESKDEMTGESDTDTQEPTNDISVKREPNEEVSFSAVEESIMPVKVEGDSDSLLLDKPVPKIEDDDISYQFIPLKREDEGDDMDFDHPVDGGEQAKKEGADDNNVTGEEEEEEEEEEDDETVSETEEEEEEEEEEDFDIDAFDIENPDNTLAELLLYLEHQTIQVISTIQSLLSSIKRPESTKGELRHESNAINQVIGQIVDATSVSMNQSRNANLKEHGSWVVQSLEDCSRRMKTLCKLNKTGELEPEADDSEYADKNFKQRLAGIAFDIAKCTKELVKTVEEASLKEEIEYLNMRIH